jgi:hypothetical protein
MTILFDAISASRSADQREGLGGRLLLRRVKRGHQIALPAKWQRKAQAFRQPRSVLACFDP